MTTLNIRAAAFAALVTIATLGGVGQIANAEHRQAVAALDQTAPLKVAVQQVVIVGRRTKA